MTMKYYWLLLGALAVWRITYLIAFEDGPGGFVRRFRQYASRGPLGRAVNCFYCLSMWIALPFAIGLGETWTERLLLWPALSAAACVIERVTDRGASERMPLYEEDAEEATDVLRKE
jgi:hypothetical protein